MKKFEKTTPQIAIIGAGLTGLNCAYHLEKAGYAPLLFEQKSGPGGRVFSENIDGFILDRGFQVLLSSYPEIKENFNLSQLGARAFDSGAKIRHPALGWISVYNPKFHPMGCIKSILRYPRLAVAFGKIFFELKRYQENPRLWKMGILSTEELLEHLHISKEMIDNFFRPFFGGVFLENSLHTQAPIFMKRFYQFLTGRAYLPAEGMGALPKQMAARLKKTQTHYQKTIVEIREHFVKLENGDTYHPDIIICCFDSQTTNRFFPLIPCHQMVGVTCLYFSIDSALIKPHKMLMLGNAEGPINNLSIDSAVQPTYAPKGQHLLSATVVESKWQKARDLEARVKEQITSWLDAEPRHLRSYIIDTALPSQDHPPPLVDYHHPRHEGIYIAGEVVDSASINGALASGKKIAHKIIGDLAISKS